MVWTCQEGANKAAVVHVIFFFIIIVGRTTEEEWVWASDFHIHIEQRNITQPVSVGLRPGCVLTPWLFISIYTLNSVTSHNLLVLDWGRVVCCHHGSLIYILGETYLSRSPMYYFDRGSTAYGSRWDTLSLVIRSVFKVRHHFCTRHFYGWDPFPGLSFVINE